MKVLFIGLGSIGTRHLKNLTAIARQRGIELTVDALRSSRRELPQETTALLTNEYFAKEDTAEFYDVVFVTNPTNEHFETIKAFSEKTGAFFLEKPIFEHDEYSLAQCGLEGKPAYVACPMRHSETFRQMKKAVEAQRVYSARLICSSYLPGWRPNADYRTVYSAHKDMGGGVSIDLIHEWDYFIDLFGFPKESYNLQGRYSDLEIDSEDLSIYIARYENMLVELHLDYFGRTYRRTAELFTEEGTIIADFGARTLTLANGTLIDCAEDTNEWYIHEMNYFLDYVQGKCGNMNTPEHALKAMRLAQGKAL
ncbi:Gfo/Idh/MocA family oxidoreductase [Ruminococcaceae bacterium OttesenSCG-928-N02]|nr:Gfo/Idh/MocA family oxidoreductase [Ruminococcaceae bacterium OttesenSCG-928-N02]